MNTSQLEFQKVYEDFQPKILRYLAHLVGESDADDLVQETFIKVHQALGGFRGESQLSTWIYRIATNTALDKLRSPSFQQTKQIFAPDELEEIGAANGAIPLEGKKLPIEKELIRAEMNQCIRDYIEKLPEDYRMVLVLSEYEELKNSEVAEILGVSLETVKIRLHRAKEKLKKELKEHCEFYWIEEMPCSVK